MDRRDNLALRHGLAAADDAPIARVLAHQLCPLLVGQATKDRPCRPDRVPCPLHAQLLPGIPQHLNHSLGDGGRRGQPRRFDAAQVDEAPHLIRDLDDEIPVVVDSRVGRRGVAPGAQAGKDRDDMTAVEGGHQLLSPTPHLVEPLWGHGSILFVLDLLGVRPNDGVAVRGRRHQDALAHLAGDGEEDIVDLELVLVQHVVLAPPRRDGELRADACPVHHGIRVQPRGVDHPTGAKDAAVCADADDTARVRRVPHEILEACAAQQGHAVHDGVLPGSDGRPPGVTDAAGGAIERPRRIGVDRGLPPSHLLA